MYRIMAHVHLDVYHACAKPPSTVREHLVGNINQCSLFDLISLVTLILASSLGLFFPNFWLGGQVHQA